MSGLLNFTRHERGWATAMPTEMAQVAGVDEGSILVLHFNEGRIETEILPPVTEEMKQHAKRASAKFHEAFAEMERRGD
jgi:hypothetical protein